jgi:hypothetical protein
MQLHLWVDPSIVFTLGVKIGPQDEIEEAWEQTDDKDT